MEPKATWLKPQLLYKMAHGDLVTCRDAHSIDIIVIETLAGGAPIQLAVLVVVLTPRPPRRIANLQLPAEVV